MPYDKLRTFVAVMDSGSVSAAAVRMHRTQSAISQQVKALEEELGLGLVDRRGGRLFLTVEGRRIYDIAADGFQRIEAELARIRNDGHTEQGTVRIGVVPEFSNQVLTPRLGDIRARLPNICVEVVVGTSEQIEQQLLDNRLDIGLLVTFSQKDLFDVRPCVREACIVVASKGYVEAHGPFRTYKAVADADVVDFAEDFTCMSIWMRKNAPGCVARLTHRRPAVILKDHHGLAEVVRRDGGIALLPRAVVAGDLKSGSLVELMPRSKPVFVTLDAAVRKSRANLRLLRLCLDCLGGA